MLEVLRQSWMQALLVHSFGNYIYTRQDTAPWGCHKPGDLFS
jgi:hypothetical protein